MAELDSSPKAIQSLYSWYSEDKLQVNRRYQRKLVWTQEEKQKLVESILNRYPVPAILLAESEDGGYEIIDGLQRLHTIVSFIETAFPTLTEANFDVAQFPTAKVRLDNGEFELNDSGAVLTAKEVSTYLDYPLAVSVMRGATPDEIDDVFRRINAYGHRLSDQERRQSGVQDAFAELIREVACTVRGDSSADILSLSQMPAISIDLPMSKHGYEVRAEQVYWVQEGILRSTDLRDSLDEQCLADIAACIISGQLIERSKSALDAIYEVGSQQNQQMLDAVTTYGGDKFSDELKYCMDEILQVCNAGSSSKLRDILFSSPSSNPFPALFTVLVVALHESLIVGKKRIADYEKVRLALTGLAGGRISTSRGSTSPDERRRNVDTIKGLIAGQLVDDDLRSVYVKASTTDIDSALRRSQIELSAYELKQGLLSLGPGREVSSDLIEKVVRTICGIANIGPSSAGVVMIGVTDKDDDATKVETLDGITPRQVGRRKVVGVRREAAALGESVEDYFSRWKNGIKNSDLSEPLRSAVLSNLDFNDYFGLGVIVINVPSQSGLSYVGEHVYCREGDDTVEATLPKKIAEIASRF